MFNLDLTDTKESTGFAPITPGTYFLIMDTCEVKDTKSGTGSYINAKFKILEGPAEGRFLFHMFNIKNENEKATEIGLGQLKSFMKCAGSQDFKLTNVLDLIGLRCDAVIKTRSDDYGDKSVISYFKPHAESTESVATRKKAVNPF